MEHMHITGTILLPIALLAAAEGEIAYLAGAGPLDLRVSIMDVAGGVSRPVGYGQRDGAPVWSPDGRQLAFETDTDQGGRAIAVVNADGTGLRRLDHAFAWNTAPRWAPDGRRLAYAAGSGPEAMTPDSRMAVYELETGEEQIWGGEQTGLLRPVWVVGEVLAILELEGDAALLATALHDSGSRISAALVFVTESRVVPVPQQFLPSRGEYDEWGVEPNADGDRLAYDSNDGGDREIFVLTKRRGAIDVSNHYAADWGPVWPPRRRFPVLLFESFRGGRRGIYRCTTETAHVAPVAESPDHDNWAPAWAPSAEHIAFVSDRTGSPELYLTDLGGGPAQPLTHTGGYNLAPAWRPVAQ